MGEENSSGVLPSGVIGAFIGALLGLFLFGPLGMVTGTVVGYLISKCGACKCCLLTTSALCIATLILTIVCFSVLYFSTKDVVEHLTVSTASRRSFPVIQMTDNEVDVVKDRVTLFLEELEADMGPVEDLIITQDEINGIIGHSDYLRGNMMITLHPNLIEEEYSLPVDMLPGGKDRYFVGSDYVKIYKKGDKSDDQDVIVDNTIEMKMETAAKHQDWFDGPLVFARLQYLVTKDKHDDFKEVSELFLQNGYFFGIQASDEYIKKRENLFQYIDDNCEHAEAIYEGIEEIVIEEGKIIVKPVKNIILH